MGITSIEQSTVFSAILCRVTGTSTERVGKELAGSHWAAYAIQNILQTMIFERKYK